MGALSVTANPHYREPFEPLIPGVTFVAPDDVAALEAAVTDSHRGDHRRAHPGRRWRPAAVTGVCRRRGAGDRADRHAAHRRRDSVRPRPHRPPVPLSGVRVAPGPGDGRQGHRIGRARRCGTGLQPRRRPDLRRRSRHDLRGQSPGHSRRAVRARADHRHSGRGALRWRRPHRARAAGRPRVWCAARRASAEARDRRERARRRRDARARAHRRRRSRRRGRAEARLAGQSHCGARGSDAAPVHGHRAGDRRGRGHPGRGSRGGAR